MHETMVAQSIFDTVLAQAKKHKAKPLSVRISCGQFNPINDDSLGFAFDLISRGTVCEGMKLEILHKPLTATCRACGGKFEFDIASPKCPACDSSKFDFTEDAPLLLEEIELEDNQST